MFAIAHFNFFEGFKADGPSYTPCAYYLFGAHDAKGGFAWASGSAFQRNIDLGYCWAYGGEGGWGAVLSRTKNWLGALGLGVSVGAVNAVSF